MQNIENQIQDQKLTPSSLTTPEARAIAFLETKLAEIGYELVAMEILNHREKKLCLFIDLLENTDAGISIEDCVRATRELDEPLDGNTDIESIFKGPYELEISSPGIDRPLRKASDYEKFLGEVARISTFRALTGDETGATEYSAKNPKQKNFFGILRGYEATSSSVLFGIIPDDGTRELFKKKNKPAKKEKPKPETLIRIPHELIQKANLDPEVILPEHE